jgi:hypothetical protein
MEVGAIIGYALAFLVGLILGRVWGGAAARKGGNMLAPRLGPTSQPSAPARSRFNAAASAQPDATFEAEVRRLVAAGNLINAIKLYRERTGCGLKEAKDAVERISGR